MGAGRDKESACASARLRVCVVEAHFMLEHFQGNSIHKIVLRTVVLKRGRSVAKAQALCFASSRGKCSWKHCMRRMERKAGEISKRRDVLLVKVSRTLKNCNVFVDEFGEGCLF